MPRCYPRANLFAGTLLLYLAQTTTIKYRSRGIVCCCLTMSKRRRNSSSDNEENLDDDQTYRPTRNTKKPSGYYSEKTFAASLDQALVEEQRKQRLDGDATENAYEVLGYSMYPERMYLDGDLNPVDPNIVQEAWRKEDEQQELDRQLTDNNPADNSTNGSDGNANSNGMREGDTNGQQNNNNTIVDEPKRKRRRVGELPADPKARNAALKRANRNNNNDAEAEVAEVEEAETAKEGESMRRVNTQLSTEMQVGVEMLETNHLNYPEDLSIRGLEQMRATIEKYVDPYEDDSDWQKVKWKEGTYINCDIRYTHLPALGRDFDVVLIDPPWRIRGGQHTSDEKTMFNNSNFALQYNTMSNEEIMDLDVGSLSRRGFIFLWTINSQFQFAFECLNRWGYNYVDRIIWIKKTINNNLHISQGFYILHSSEICLIGVKKDPTNGAFLEFIPKVNNDVIFAETRKKSQKPEQIYHIIERMFPGARKVELFGRNHNIRKGWLTLGNQLGEYYDWDHDLIQCDKCTNFIRVGHTRWKNRTIPNKDYCDKCFREEKLNEQEYFKLSNFLDEMAFHEYYECNGCKVRPLWGIRFSCADCPDYDLCEECFDKKLVPEELHACHNERHRWECFELPQLAGGFSVHRYRCAGCETFPIIGPRLRCLSCVNLNMCQKCFFSKKEPRQHELTHDVDLILEPQRAHHWVKCDNCGVRPIIGARYKCNSCFNFDLCEECYNKKVPTPPNYVSHKPTHTFSKIIGEEEIEYADGEGDEKSKDSA